MFSNTHTHLLTDLSGEHMPLPAEVLPQLLGSAALSGQPEAQRGLWNICEGTGAKSPTVVRLCVSESCDKRDVYLDNVADNIVLNVRQDTGQQAAQ